jgi:hypothetical protein
MKKSKVEFHPDAWARFERAVGVVAKSPPQHRTKPKRKKKRSPKAASAWKNPVKRKSNA